MSQLLTPVQTAVYTRLTAEISSATIYDDVPGLAEGQPTANFPFVVIGQDYVTAWDDDDQLGGNVFVQLHVWSRYQGKAEAKAIMADIDVALNRQHANLSATGYVFLDCLLDYSSIFDESDGVTRHGVCRYRLTVQKE
jgi:hypothetical protein